MLKTTEPTFITEEQKFKLDKEALNVTKRYEMDLEKARLYLHGPFSLLLKIKSLVIKKFKKTQVQNNN